MVLSEELKELSSSAVEGDAWKRPYSRWSSRNTDLARSVGSSASTSFSGVQSLKSYLSQIRMGMESRDFQCDVAPAEECTNSASEIHASKVNEKYERVKKLENSLYGIQSNVEMKRSNILEDIYQKINNLESKISDGEAQERRAYNETNKKIAAIERCIQAASSKHDLTLKDSVDKMEAVYKRFGEALTAEKEHWKKSEREAIGELSAQIKTIRDELEDMKQAKTHVASYLRKYIDVELPQLKTRISSANDDIAGMEKSIASGTNEDLVTLAAFIKQETSQLNEIKRSVLNEVARNADTARSHLAKESDERKHMQHRMVALMEETLKRLGSPL